MRISQALFVGTAAAMLVAPTAGFAQAGVQADATTTATTGAAGPATPAAGPSAGTQQSTNQPTSASATPGATPKLAQGSTVYDPNGGTVGTVASLDGNYAVVATSKSKVRLDKSSFAMGAKGPVIGMTAAQLDQAAAQAAPQTAAAAASAKPDVVKGASVMDTQGGAVGTIADVDSQFATVTLTTGGKVRLPVTAFGADDNGALRVAMTAAQLSAAAGAATPAKGG